MTDEGEEGRTSDKKREKEWKDVDAGRKEEGRMSV